MRITFAFALVSVSAVSAVSCVPKNYTPTDQVPKIGTLKEVMDVQATAADPQFKKIDAPTLTDADFRELGELAKKIDATSLRIKAFTKGPEFDGVAMQLNEKAHALGKAVESKDTNAAKTALFEMKATCKECHSRFR